MRIAVLSDTHGNIAAAVKVLDQLGSFDSIIHLGDTADDAEIIETAIGRELVKISGNCDLYRRYPDSAVLTISGKKFFLTHGDFFLVKSGLTKIYQKAEQIGADIVLYGHTHAAFIQEINGILFLNPGTLTKSAKNPSIGIVVVRDGAVNAEIVYLNRLSGHSGV